MGIQGLIPFLDKVSSRINISQYRHCCVAVDAYCWLHKGAYTCAEKLAKGEKCDAYVFYCMKYVNMLLSHNIKPILVFDGRHLPAKAGTEKKRRESRELNRKTAAELLKAGRDDEARNYLRRCVDVTHAMALALIHECRKINVDCIVAPYEADAQLAYLNLQNIAEIVITEDSDLVLFGCSKIVFKLDLQGYGLLVEQERLYLSMGVRVENFSFDSFRYMCILSGCDYLPSLPGIGLNKALKFIKKTRDPDIHRALRRLPAYLNMTHLCVSDEYRDLFVVADATFRYQPVFDPRSRLLVPLTEPPEGQEPPAIVKEQLPPAVALNLALGNLDPFTLAQVDSFDPDCPQQGMAALQRRKWGPLTSTASAHPSIWASNFSGLQPPVEDKSYFPGTLNCSALLDVTPLRMSKHPAAAFDAVAKINTQPSQNDLLSMYGGSEPPAQECKRKCVSARESVVHVPSVAMHGITSSAECNAAADSATFCKGQQVLDTLSQRKSCNPFAKPKQEGLGPLGAMGRPNYFSALRKFDGVYPMEIDPSIIVVSRSSRAADSHQSEKIERSPEVLKDLSNLSSLSATEDASSEEAVLAGYSYEKENDQKASLNQPTSVLSALETMQDQVDCWSTEPGGPHAVQKGNVRMIEVDRQQGKEAAAVRSPVPSFDWSQFTCRRSLSVPKLNSSQTVGRTFKNPFHKKVASKCNVSMGGESLAESEGGASEHCSLGHAMEVVDLTLDGNDAATGSPTSAANLSNEDIFEATQEELEHCWQPCAEGLATPDKQGLCGDGAEHRMALVSALSVEADVRPSEDALCEQLQAEQGDLAEATEVQLSGTSCDSGYLGSQDKPFKVGVVGAERRGTTTIRRLGLGRSSTLHAAPQKQNLLARYGFSKKRKLAH